MVGFFIRLDELQRIVGLGTGSERALLVVGDKGAGKTALLVEAGRVQAGSVYVPAAFDEFAGPLSGLHMLFDAIGGPVAAELTEALLACSRRGTSAFDTTTALIGIARRLKLQHAMLLLDDVDRLDAESQLVLGHFVRRMSGVGVGIVLALEAVDADGPFSGLDILRLAPLDAMGSLALARAVAPHRTDEAVLRAAALAGNGSPLAIVEAIEPLGRGVCEGREPLTLPLPAGPGTSQRVDGELGLVGGGTRTAAEAISCALRMDLRVYRRMFADGSEALEELLLAGLVVQDGRHVSVARPEVRSVAYWGQEPEARRQRHRVLAEEHAAVGDDVTALWHRSLVESTGDGGAGLVQAAIGLIDAGEALMGIEYLELARQLSGIPPALADLFGTAAKGLFLRGEFAFAFRYLQFATVFGSGDCRMEREALSLCMDPHTSSVVSVDSALAFAGEFGADHPERVAQVLGHCAFLFAERLQLEDATALIDLARRLPFGDGGEAAMLTGLAEQLVHAMNGKHHRVRGEFSRVVSAATTCDPHIASVLAGRVLTHAEEYQEAARLFDGVLRSHGAARYWSEKARLYLADNEYRAGRLRRALAETGAVVRSCTDPLVHRSMRLLLGSWYWQSEGATGRAQSLAEEIRWLASMTHDAGLSARALAQKGRAAAMAGEWERALPLLSRAQALASDYANPNWLRHEPDLVEALVACGRAREARQVLAGFSVRSGRCPSRWAELAIAGCTALVNDGEASLEDFEKAVGMWGMGDSDYMLARTLLAYGTRLAMLGRQAAADERLGAAQQLFREIGMQSMAGRPAVQPRESARETTREPVPSTVELTEEERAVARLVGEGARNKDIAAELYVSLRTVEFRLTSIYRKLGVGSRAQMTAVLSKSGARPVPS